MKNIEIIISYLLQIVNSTGKKGTPAEEAFLFKYKLVRRR